MSTPHTCESRTRAANKNNFTASDVAQILREHSWHSEELSAGTVAWCERAAALLGPQSADRPALENLLA